LRGYSRAPREQLNRHRGRLHQLTRELRAATRRGVTVRAQRQHGLAKPLDRAAATLARREREALAGRAATLRALDPERTLERGYALALGEDGEPLSSVDEVRRAGRFDLRVADGSVPAEVRDSAP
jgi:exodeoxyribonuclease VII large subunit